MKNMNYSVDYLCFLVEQKNAANRLRRNAYKRHNCPNALEEYIYYKEKVKSHTKYIKEVYKAMGLTVKYDANNMIFRIATKKELHPVVHGLKNIKSRSNSYIIERELFNTLEQELL